MYFAELYPFCPDDSISQGIAKSTNPYKVPPRFN